MIQEFIETDSSGEYIAKNEFKDVLKIKYIKAGALLHKQGQVVTKNFFILKGIARCFMYKDGKEVTTYFAVDNSPIIAIDVMGSKNKKSNLNIELLEDSIVVEMNFFELRAIIFNNQNYSKKYCLYLDGEYTKLAMAQISSRFTTAKERYQKFCVEYPQICQLVKLSHIASYLNISLETLSRIRASYKIKPNSVKVTSISA